MRTTKDKKELLVKFIELMVYGGYDISGFICKQLSYFDYDLVEKRIKELEVEQEINED